MQYIPCKMKRRVQGCSNSSSKVFLAKTRGPGLCYTHCSVTESGLSLGDPALKGDNCVQPRQSTMSSQSLQKIERYHHSIKHRAAIIFQGNMWLTATVRSGYTLNGCCCKTKLHSCSRCFQGLWKPLPHTGYILILGWQQILSLE